MTTTQNTFTQWNTQTFIIATNGAWRLFNSNPEQFITLAAKERLQKTVTQTTILNRFTFNDDATIILATKPA